MKMEETKGFKMHKNKIGKKNNTREKREKAREREEKKRVMYLVCYSLAERYTAGDYSYNNAPSAIPPIPLPLPLLSPY
jgi:hypothetical protein